MSTALFAWASNSYQSTTSAEFVDIEGLSFPLPLAGADFNAAIVTLNVTQPYAENGTDNGIRYGITGGDGNKVLVAGEFSNQPSQSGRSPITLVTMIPLTHFPQSARAQWAAVRGATARLDGQASLSAVLVNIT